MAQDRDICSSTCHNTEISFLDCDKRQVFKYLCCSFLYFPGVFFFLPCIDKYEFVDLRTVSFDVPPQEVGSIDVRQVLITVFRVPRLKTAIERSS